MLLHHVQISIPAGGEPAARAFYGDALGLIEVDKPEALAGRGGCWFRAMNDGRVTAEIHLGIEAPHHPAAKAHPGLLVSSATELEALAARIGDAGAEVSWVERHSFTGYQRFHCTDPFGNRVEVMAPDAPS